MITETPNLRLHIADDGHHNAKYPAPPSLESIPGISDLIRLFPQITGWELDYQQARTSAKANTAELSSPWDSLLPEREADNYLQAFGRSPEPSLFELGIVDMSSEIAPGQSCSNRQKCDAIVGTINSLVQQIHTAHKRIEKLQAQIATAIPLTVTEDDGQILLSRLQAVIGQALTMLDLSAAGLYLLDDDTRELHLRVHVGLSPESYLRKPRPLKESLADLEALVGNTLSIAGPEQTRNWNCPENFPSAFCVPVATHSAPLGTLWLFSDQERSFTGSDFSLAEIIGGRLASELEREAAVREGSVSRKLGRDIDRAQLWQQLQVPPLVADIKGWQIQGNQILNQGVGGALYDFSISPKGMLTASVGDIQGAVFESGLAAATMRGALRSLEPRNLKADRVVYEINNTLWNCPLGDQIGSLFQLELETDTGIARWANAGETGAIIVGSGSEAHLAEESSPLGACPNESFEIRERVVLPQSTLFAFNNGFRRLFKFKFQKSTDQDIIERMRAESLILPSEIKLWINELAAGFDSYRTTPDVSFVAIHREPESVPQKPLS